MGKLREVYKPGDKKRGAVPNKPKEVFKYNGWASCDHDKPREFDIVLIKDEKNRIQRGWWTGFAWDFGRKVISKPTFWRLEDIYWV